MRYGRHNPLSPYAFDTEKKPFIIEGQATSREQHVGVHTATEEHLAVLYAVQRAMIDGTLAILFDLDVTGLRALPDRDAILEAEQTDATHIFDVEGVVEAFEAGDGDEIVDLLDDYLSMADTYYESRGRPDTWSEAMGEVIDREKYGAEARAVANMLPDDALSALQMLADKKTLPPRVWMEVVGQQRYMDDFDLDRVVRVRAVRPVRNELWSYDEIEESDEDYAPDDPDQPQIFSEMSFADGHYTPEMVTLWTNPNARLDPKVEYHGTDDTRALSAFPSLKKHLVNPWPYTQSVEDVGGPAMFTTPQWMIEAEEAKKQGVGIFPMAVSTGRFLLGERSWAVNDPGQWAGFGGSLNFNEDARDGAMRELREETGYDGPAELHEIAPNIFVAHIPEEYEPQLNWETEMAAWFEPSEVARLEPPHWGTTVLIREVIGG